MTFPAVELALKRYGYVGKLNDDTLRAVSDDINLYHKSLEKAGSPQAKYYRSKEIFNQGNYNVQQMLRLAFVMSHHHSHQHAVDAFWGLVNPSIKESVAKQQVEQLLRGLVFWAVEFPQHLFNNEEEPQEDVLAWLKKCAENINSKIEEQLAKLPAQVTYNDVHDIAPFWSSAYKIRQEFMN